MVDGTGLENRRLLTGSGGSNPSLSATLSTIYRGRATLLGPNMSIPEYTLVAFFVLLMGIALGSITTWLMSRREFRLFEEQAKFREQTLSEQIAAMTNLREENNELHVALARLETTLTEERRNYSEKIQLLEDARQNLSEAFRSLSTEVLQANSKQFLELAEQSLAKHHEQATGQNEKRKQEIDALVKPLAESLKAFDSKVGDLERMRTSAYAGLLEQLKLQQESIGKLNLETTSLVHALRSSSTRGSWGEIQLRRVVELAGMLPYCDFIEQTHSEKDGMKLRPDMVIKLPNDKNIVVDSKAPLKAFLEALDLTDESQKRLKMIEHSRQMRNHVQQLGAKNYWEQFQPSPEFVVLFLPGEAYFNAAMENDPTLIEFGVDRRVILSTPSSLIALLKAVAYGWKQEQLAVNAQEVKELGQSLHERVLTLAKYFIDLRKGIESTVSAYNKTVGAMESRVLVTTRKFQDLGAARGDSIPQIDIVETSPRELGKLIENG